VVPQERCQPLADPGRAEQRPRAVLVDVPDDRGRLEVGGRVLHRQHEGRLPVAQEDGAHDQRPGPMVALDEKLRLAQHPHVHAGGAAPGGLVGVARVPLDHVLDPGLPLLVEAPLAGGQMAGVGGPPRFAPPAQHERVQLQQMLDVAEGEHVGAGRDERVHEGVAGQHVVDDAVVQRIAVGAQALVDAGELGLHAPQRRLDGCEVQAPRRPDQTLGQWMRSSAARDREATSGGNAMYPRSRL